MFEVLLFFNTCYSPFCFYKFTNAAPGILCKFRFKVSNLFVIKLYDRFAVDIVMFTFRFQVLIYFRNHMLSLLRNRVLSLSGFCSFLTNWSSIKFLKLAKKKRICVQVLFSIFWNPVRVYVLPSPALRFKVYFLELDHSTFMTYYRLNNPPPQIIAIVD